jgi:hypothetical protein
MAQVLNRPTILDPAPSGFRTEIIAPVPKQGLSVRTPTIYTRSKYIMSIHTVHSIRKIWATASFKARFWLQLDASA